MLSHFILFHEDKKFKLSVILEILIYLKAVRTGSIFNLM